MSDKSTKLEIIGILFAKLKPEKNEVFADIGCGSGNVSDFFAPFVKKVYAVDVDENAINQARKKLSKYKNVELINSDGYEFLKRSDCDIVFFGGTKNIEKMLEVCKARKIAVNAARIEIAVKVVEKMKNMGIFKEILIVNISKSYELAGGTAFKNLNPVFVVVGGKC